MGSSDGFPALFMLLSIGLATFEEGGDSAPAVPSLIMTFGSLLLTIRSTPSRLPSYPAARSGDVTSFAESAPCPRLPGASSTVLYVSFFFAIDLEFDYLKVETPPVAVLYFDTTIFVGTVFLKNGLILLSLSFFDRFLFALSVCAGPLACRLKFSSYSMNGSF